MNKREIFRKCVAWSLIATLINPAMMTPAFARDSDIYLNTTTGTSTAEPNVLFVLGTNDRMNVAEAWREYDPDVYDSHVEYLWNDINVISTTEVKTEDPNRISTIAPPTNPASPWGTWSGTLTTDRQALWTATLLYALGTQPGDPVVAFSRGTYRNYFNGSWLYWLPAGSDITTDKRLWSTSFNRFQAHIQMVPGVRGGVTFPAPTVASSPPPTAAAPYRLADGVTVDYRQFNLCSSSIAQLTPSTVFAPTNAPPNAGYYLNQQWVRYEPYLGLSFPSNIAPTYPASYPGNNTTANGATPNKSTGPTTDTFFRGYVDGTVAATNTLSVPPTNVYRDNWPDTDPVPSQANVGKQGQPIRIQGASATAGWTDPKADLGGFVFQSQVANATFYTQAVLNNLRTGAYGGSYSLPSFTGSNVLLQEQFAAWLGNRDNATPPAFGNMVGTPAYFDITVASCDPSAGPLAPNQCLQFGGTTGTITQDCIGGGIVQQERDASTTVRFTGGTCVATAAAPVCTTTAGYSGTDLTKCPGVAIPACTLRTDPQNLFYTKFYEAPCGFTGQTTVTVATCQWSDRQSVYIEGQGTIYYGGTCAESGSQTSCTAGGDATRLVNGVVQTNVIGPIPGPQPAEPDARKVTLGCDNSIAAGNYSYGGTCGGGTEYQMPGGPSPSASTPASPGARTLRVPTECTGPAGGTSLSIRGDPPQTYNQSCTNTAGNPGSGTCSAWYGTTCLVSNVPATYCPPAQNSGSILAGNFYQAYKQRANQPNLYHECLADGPMLNPGGNSYPNKAGLTFGTLFSSTAAAGASTTAAYTQTSGEGVAADANKKIDVYSVNYLNWKFGAKACRNAAGALITNAIINGTPAGATCSPIGRKTRLQVAKDALSGIVAKTDGVRLGLMVYNKTDTTLSSEGGNIVYAIRRMGSNATDTPAYNNRGDLVKAIQNVVASSRTPLTETLYEAYRYFSGRTPKWGISTTGAAVGGVVSQGRELSVGTNIDPPGAPGNVFLTSAGGKYNSPMLNNPNVAEPANCQKNYIVMITNGQPEEDFSANADIKTIQWKNPAGNIVAPRTDLDTNGARPTNAGPPDYQQIPTVAGGKPYGDPDLAGTGNDGGFVWLDELTYFIASSDVSPGANNGLAGDVDNADLISGRQSIVTYTIGFAGVSAPVVQNAAVAAQGVFYIAQNAQQLQSALVSAFIAIRNFNPTAAAATVPISSLNRGESSTDVYLAFFGPSASKSTWPGTVKKYQLSTDAKDCGAGIPLCLTGQSAIASTGLKNIETTDPVTGQTVVDPTAASGPNADGTAWTPKAVQDGAKPDKGGSGYVLINTSGYTPDTRKLYTYLSGGVSSSVNLTAAGNSMHFNNSAITKTLLGNAGMTNVQQETLINYIRGGADGVDPVTGLASTRCTDGTGTTTCDTWAPWPHFGVEHSTPAIVTYDASTAPPVQYLYYVQNNGMLTAVEANTGKEKWSFLIEEALPQLSTMQQNNPGPEIYVADGSPTVYFDDQNSNGVVDGSDRVWLYFGLRRGGRSMYAIDITQRDAPAFKWKITANSGTGKVCVGTSACTTVTAFDELGQTWSTPTVARLKKFPNAGDPPAVIFGGGYDADAEDTVPAEFNKARSMGRALYVVNGDTGALIQAWGAGAAKAGQYRTGYAITTYSIPSDVTAISTDFDPYVDRVYVGDMGGNVWRFDVDDKDENNWRAELLASLSNPSGEKRKFFFAPAIAPQGDPFKFDGVYIGSGDKEHPSLTSTSTPATTDDRMFMLMDDPSLNSGGGTPSSDTTLSGLATPITLSTLLDISDTDATKVGDIKASVLIGKQGWMRRLDNGEKVVNSPTVFFGALRFGTYAPLNSINACTPPGEGRLNEIDSLTGALFALNSTGIGGASQRWYSGFLSHGYMSPTQLLVLPGGTKGQDKTVYTFTCADANCLGKNILTLGAPTKIYWYMEPEQ